MIPTRTPLSNISINGADIWTWRLVNYEIKVPGQSSKPYLEGLICAIGGYQVKDTNDERWVRGTKRHRTSINGALSTRASMPIGMEVVFLGVKIKGSGPRLPKSWNRIAYSGTIFNNDYADVNSILAFLRH